MNATELSSRVKCVAASAASPTQTSVGRDRSAGYSYTENYFEREIYITIEKPLATKKEKP